jgi:hypothetical protein
MVDISNIENIDTLKDSKERTALIKFLDYIAERLEKMKESNPAKNRSLSFAEVIEINKPIIQQTFVNEFAGIDSQNLPYKQKNEQISALKNKLSKQAQDLVKEIESLEAKRKIQVDKQKELDDEIMLKKKELESNKTSDDAKKLNKIEIIKQLIDNEKTLKKQQLVATQTTVLLKKIGGLDAVNEELIKRFRPGKYIEPILRPMEVMGGLFGAFTLVTTAIAAFALLATPVGLALTAAVVGGLFLTGVYFGVKYAFKSYKTQKNTELAEELQLRIIQSKEELLIKNNVENDNLLKKELDNKVEKEKELVKSLKQLLINRAIAVDESLLKEIESIDDTKGIKDNKGKITDLIDKLNDKKKGSIDDGVKQKILNYQSFSLSNPPDKKAYAKKDYFKKTLFTSQFALETAIAGMTIPGLAFGIASVVTLFIPGVNIVAAAGLAIFAASALIGAGMVYFSRRAQAKRKDDVLNAIGEHQNNVTHEGSISKQKTNDLKSLKQKTKEIQELSTTISKEEQKTKLVQKIESKDEKLEEDKKLFEEDKKQFEKEKAQFEEDKKLENKQEKQERAKLEEEIKQLKERLGEKENINEEIKIIEKESINDFNRYNFFKEVDKNTPVDPNKNLSNTPYVPT